MHSNSPVRTHPYFASCYLSVSLNHGLRLTPWAPGQQLSLFPLLLPVFLAPPPRGRRWILTVWTVFTDSLGSSRGTECSLDRQPVPRDKCTHCPDDGIRAWSAAVSQSAPAQPCARPPLGALVQLGSCVPAGLPAASSLRREFLSPGDLGPRRVLGSVRTCVRVPAGSLLRPLIRLRVHVPAPQLGRGRACSVCGRPPGPVPRLAVLGQYFPGDSCPLLSRVAVRLALV